ncbi:MAG: methylenetetrahydrofolate reductase [NAD(P)H] [Aquificae bacterium]|nr:methylenetetrahydrofolate reductase [NAD(P)H] [Aquificota bacterium]
MKICEYLKEGNFSLSYEFFPPKDEKGKKQLFETIEELLVYKPTFVSVTYGAGGSTRDRTFNTVKEIKEKYNLTVMPHLTCVAQQKEDILALLDKYRQIGIENILALRGDQPKDNPQQGFCKYAIDLIRLIKDNYKDQFCIGVACYPEGHQEAPSLEEDIKHLKEKIEAGGKFAITQMFFRNEDFFRFKELLQKEGVDIPILIGVMPITNFKQIKKFADLCGATIPLDLAKKLSEVQDKPEEVFKIGVEYAIKQCEELLDYGVDGFHFYTLNKPQATKEIIEALKDKIFSLRREEKN